MTRRPQIKDIDLKQVETDLYLDLRNYEGGLTIEEAKKQSSDSVWVINRSIKSFGRDYLNRSGNLSPERREEIKKQYLGKPSRFLIDITSPTGEPQIVYIFNTHYPQDLTRYVDKAGLLSSNKFKDLVNNHESLLIIPDEVAQAYAKNPAGRDEFQRLRYCYGRASNGEFVDPCDIDITIEQEEEVPTSLKLHNKVAELLESKDLNKMQEPQLINYFRNIKHELNELDMQRLKDHDHIRKFTRLIESLNTR
jgi:hypothetical protein